MYFGWAKAGWPARTYIQQLCVDTGCSPEDLPEAMNDREARQDDDEKNVEKNMSVLIDQ